MDLIYYHNLNPVFLQLGPLELRWYGLMYAIAFVIGYFLLLKLVKMRNENLSKDDVSDLLFYIILGVLIGGRLGHAIFYGFPDYYLRPWKVFEVWKGGMSFHGGLIGVLISVWVYSKKKNISLLRLSDLIVPIVPIGLFLGRIGNFINGELWGKPTHSNFGVIFPQVDSLPRHPTQLYEAFLEGVMLFAIIWFAITRKNYKSGIALALFLIFYGLFRTLIEFVRMPDVQLGYLFGFITMGQLLSIPMIAIGTFLYFKINKKSS